VLRSRKGAALGLAKRAGDGHAGTIASRGVEHSPKIALRHESRAARHNSQRCTGDTSSFVQTLSVMACDSVFPGPELPAVPAGDLCSALSWTSRAAWGMITDQLDQKLNGIQRRMIEERAITDVALTIVRRMSPGQADVTLFTQADEAATGADFELLVFDEADNVLPFLVQAKPMKVLGGAEGYPGLGQTAAGSGGQRQYDRLLAACKPDGEFPNHAPLHIFYNGERLATREAWPDDACENASGSATDEPARGITVAHTQTVVEAIESGRRSHRVSRVAPVCWPWWCLFCCRRVDLSDLASRVVRRREPASTEPTRPTILAPQDQPRYAMLARRRDGRKRVIELPRGDPLPGARAVIAIELESPAAEAPDARPPAGSSRPGRRIRRATL
jgi:hypothetical protein